MEKEVVFDIVKTNVYRLNERTVASFKDYDEARKFIENFSYFDVFVIRRRETCKVWSSFEEFVNNTPGAKQKIIQNRLTKLKSSSIDIPIQYAILEKVSDEEKIKLGLDSNYLKHDAFTINEIKTILDSVDKEKIKQDGKVLITYPGTDNYAMISLNQYNLLENALRERIEKMENVYKTLEKLTDESEI